MHPGLIDLIVIGSILVVLTTIVFILTYPGRRRPGMEDFLRYKYAHRGLHDAEHAENSLSAFALAVERGFGIELDVHVSRDGEVVVFHDNTLKRVCGVDGKVGDYTAAELAALSLSGTSEGVPTFREVLSLVNGRVPILIEMKAEVTEDREIAKRTLAVLEGYEGPYMIQSFNPLAVGEVRENAPSVMRGFLGSHLTKKKFNFKHFLVEHFLLNFIARPDFVAYDKTCYTFFPFVLFRLRHLGCPLFCWTVRSADEERIARSRGFDTVIFENYVPDELYSHPVHHYHERHKR